MLGDIGDRDVLPNDFPMKKEPISLATIKKQEVKVKWRPVVFDRFSNEIKPGLEIIISESNYLNLIQ